MPTVDELLNASNEVTTCTINPDTREIIVPEKYKVLGVFSDEKVTKIPFTCPKVVGNNVDLTEYNLYINYENAIGKSNAYLIEDVAVSGDNITFSWLLSRNVTVSPGVVKYSFCAKKLDGDTISNEWNTTIANGLVIQGLEATREIIEENPDIIETLLTKSHVHINKLVLDKFAETDGKPTYNGEALGGAGASDFIIKMTVTSDDNGNYTVTSCDTTIEQIETAVAAEKRVVLIATDTTTGMFLELPIVQAVQGETYIFIAFTFSGYIMATVYKSGENEIWEFLNGGISAESVSYYNSTQQDVETVMAALNKLFTTKVTTGSNITLADNTEYRLTNVTTLTLTYPAGNFECWMRLNFAANGNPTVIFPAGTKYIGTTPDFKNGETWELSIKDGVVIAQKVGEGA